MDDQFARIYDQLESIQAQLRSLTATIAANNVGFVGQLSKLEVEQRAHASQDDERHAAIDGHVRDLLGRLKTLEDLHQQAKGAAILWRLGAALVAAAVGGLELWRVSHH